jgi:hypothetical protein
MSKLNGQPPDIQLQLEIAGQGGRRVRNATIKSDGSVHIEEVVDEISSNVIITVDEERGGFYITVIGECSSI